MALDEADGSRIAPYVSSLTADVFALSGLPEEVIAVLFAYYSRSRDDLRTNLARLLADQEIDVTGAPQRGFGLASEKARAFHEKWVVGYGHASVAEHAVVPVAQMPDLPVLLWLWNSVKVATLSGVVTLLLSTTASYALARVQFRGRRHALKLLRDSGLASAQEMARFRIEAEAAARMAHPNIVPIYEVGEHEGCSYY